MSTAPVLVAEEDVHLLHARVGREGPLVQRRDQRQLLLRADVVPGAHERVAVGQRGPDVQPLRAGAGRAVGDGGRGARALEQGREREVLGVAVPGLVALHDAYAHAQLDAGVGAVHRAVLEAEVGADPVLEEDVGVVAAAGRAPRRASRRSAARSPRSGRSSRSPRRAGRGVPVLFALIRSLATAGRRSEERRVLTRACRCDIVPGRAAPPERPRARARTAADAPGC